MELDIRTYQVDASRALRRYAERRIRTSLRRLAGRIGHIVVDIDGWDSAHEASCRVTAELPSAGSIVVRYAHRDLFTAIEGAAHRASQVIQQRLERARDLRTGHETLRAA